MSRDKINKLYVVPGNRECADCNAENPESIVLGYNILICRKCAGVHRSMENVRVRDMSYDKISDSEVEEILKVGNKKSNEKYLKYLPIFYRLPDANGPEILRRTFIIAKYQLKQFVEKDVKRPYIVNVKLGLLKKRSKDKNSYNSRFFRLSVTDISFNYFIKESDAVNYDRSQMKLDPKRTIRLDRINATFIENPDSKARIPDELLMISFFRLEESSWRHIYLKSNTPEDLVEWYQTIRFAKYSLRAQYIVGTGEEANELELAKDLTLDITMSGWMYKTGPMLTEPWQKRWCVLLGRRLLYSSDPLSATGKGEIVIGELNKGYDVSLTAPANARSIHQDQTPLTIKTPNREYLFAIDSEGDVAEKWMTLIKELAKKEMSVREMADYRLFHKS